MDHRRSVAALIVIGLLAGIALLRPQAPPVARPVAEAVTEAPPRVVEARPAPRLEPVEPAEDGPPVVTLDGPTGLDAYGVSCWWSARGQGLEYEPPPFANDRLGDRLGSELLALTHGSLVPRWSTRRRLDDWGLTPAWIGSQLVDVNPWLALVALDTERLWSQVRTRDQGAAFRDRYGFESNSDEGKALRATDPEAASFGVERDRRDEYALALSLAGEDAVGQRALLYAGSASRQSGMSPEAGWKAGGAAALAVLHQSDDPAMLTAAADLIHPTLNQWTPADEARVLEVMPVLSPEVGGHLALKFLRRDWVDGDREGALRWWRHYEPLVAYCEALPDDVSAFDAAAACGCVPMNVEGNLANFLHHGLIEPVDLEERMILASARCVVAGHRAGTGVVPADSPMGRCVQAELGPDPVLGVDVDLAYRRSR